jgi:hypothetical protein
MDFDGSYIKIKLINEHPFFIHSLIISYSILSSVTFSDLIFQVIVRHE